jgi:hypothetical protein
MHRSITDLVAIAGESTCAEVSGMGVLNKWGALGEELAEMLERRNGFYAYDSALLVRPLTNLRAPLGLVQWNAQELWKGRYMEDLVNAFCFAEDVFGGQYCIRQDQVCVLDPETGILEEMSSSLGEWATNVIADYQFRTGYALAHEWQIRNIPLMAGTRLLPKVPFICGGKYDVENLYPVADVEGMLFRASIANQIRELPDGTEIVFRPGNDAKPGR